jgi:hypothetical protein
MASKRKKPSPKREDLKPYAIRKISPSRIDESPEAGTFIGRSAPDAAPPRKSQTSPRNSKR